MLDRIVMITMTSVFSDTKKISYHNCSYVFHEQTQNAFGRSTVEVFFKVILYPYLLHQHIHNMINGMFTKGHLRHHGNHFMLHITCSSLLIVRMEVILHEACLVVDLNLNICFCYWYLWLLILFQTLNLWLKGDNEVFMAEIKWKALHAYCHTVRSYTSFGFNVK